MLTFLLTILGYCMVGCLGQLTPQDFLITDLPDYNGTFSNLGFKQYAGYEL